MNYSELGVVKGDCVFVGKEVGNRRTGNQETTANGFSHAESRWRLKELTEGAVTRALS